MNNDDNTEDDRFTPEFPGRIIQGDEAKMIVVAQSQIQQIARESGIHGARTGIKEMWHQLGVKYDDTDGMSALNEDLRWVRRTRLDERDKDKSLRERLGSAAFSIVGWIAAAVFAYFFSLAYHDLHPGK